MVTRDPRLTAVWRPLRSQGGEYRRAYARRSQLAKRVGSRGGYSRLVSPPEPL